MLGKFTAAYMNDMYNRGSKSAFEAYRATRRTLGKVHYGVNMARTVYNVLKPMLESRSQSAPVSKALTRGFQTYDDLKEKVVRADTSIRDVGSQIARKIPELRFNN